MYEHRELQSTCTTCSGQGVLGTQPPAATEHTVVARRRPDGRLQARIADLQVEADQLQASISGNDAKSSPRLAALRMALLEELNSYLGTLRTAASHCCRRPAV